MDGCQKDEVILSLPLEDAREISLTKIQGLLSFYHEETSIY